jgi:eukaryotic-like serine/threonine-protein kinase
MLESTKPFAPNQGRTAADLEAMDQRTAASELRFGDYLIEEQIGHGGMGVVYRAHHLSLGRTVALKLLLLGRYSSAESVERFKREARAVAALRHPNIVAIHEVGESEGQHFFAMEYVEGKTLAHVIHAPRRAAELARDVADAVHYAHTQGVLHRDLKPSNILIDAEGRVRVTDFGLATNLDGSSDLTLTGQILGTPNYLSPERALGKRELAPTSDVYAIGAILYEMLTGRPPFLAASLQETLLGIRDNEPVSPRSLNPFIPRDLETICLKCLQKEPSRRYPTADALARDLNCWLHQRPILARPAGVMERLWLGCRRKPRQAVLFGLLGLAFAAVLMLLVGIATVSTRARWEAEAQKLTMQRRAYSADINLIQQALVLNNLGRAEELLNQERPRPGRRDLRDWEWRYLWQQCQSEAEFILSQRPNSIWSLTVSHDGRWVAVGEENQGGLSIWDWAAREKVAELSFGKGEVEAAFSPTEPLLACSHETGRQSAPFGAGVLLWNPLTREVIADLPLSGRCRGLAFSQDGQRLLISSAAPGNRIEIWRVADREKLLDYAAPQFDGVGTPFAATRDLALAAHRTEQNGEISLVDLSTGTERWRINATTEVVTALAFSPDGRVLASGSGYSESAIRLWDVATGNEIGKLEGHTGWVSALVFWPEGNRLASISADQMIRLWDLNALRGVGSLRGQRREGWRLSLLPDGHTLISGGKDGLVHVWDTRRLRPDRRRVILPVPIAGAHFQRDGQSLLTVDRHGQVATWNVPDFSEPQSLFEVGGPVAIACVSRGGERLAVQAPDGPIQVWDLPGRALLGTFGVPGSFAYLGGFRENGRKLVLFNWGGDDFHEWDVGTFQQTQTWRVAGDRPAATLSRDGRYSLSIGQEANTMLRDLVTGQMISGPLDIQVPGGIALSPDGKIIAAVSKQSYVRLWDFHTRQEIATFRGFLQGLHGVAFSANGRRLAIGSNGREAVKLWDLESRQELMTLAGEGSIFKGLEFSPDGNILAARNNQGLLHLWRAPSWKEIAEAEASARP